MRGEEIKNLHRAVQGRGRGELKDVEEGGGGSGVGITSGLVAKNGTE